MAIRKKAKKAKKQGKKKAVRSTATRPGAGKVNIVARRSTNRLAARPKGAGEPPDTVNQAALDGAVRAWISQPKKRKSDYARYQQPRMIRDGREMQQGRADLPLFISKKTPITAAHFDWLDLLLENLDGLGDDQVDVGAQDEVLDEDLQLAVNDVMDARGAISRRAECCGIPLSLFSVERSSKDPFAVFNAGSRAARMARKRLTEFNDPAYAETLVEALETALGVLDGLLEGKDGTRSDRGSVSARRAALKRLLFDAMTYLAPWGRDVTAGDPTKEGRYQLDHIFPGRDQRRPAKTTPATTTPAAPR
ncbi:MAG: hypothetical protein HY904_09035 [Deltaproteobacteria bacterium]|nr:hypothetical protein [Deltaproteobacteria bacterium]